MGRTMEREHDLFIHFNPGSPFILIFKCQNASAIELFSEIIEVLKEGKKNAPPKDKH